MAHDEPKASRSPPNEVRDGRLPLGIRDEKCREIAVPAIWQEIIPIFTHCGCGAFGDRLES